jgi:hypothetical protein
MEMVESFPQAAPVIITKERKGLLRPVVMKSIVTESAGTRLGNKMRRWN